VSTILESLPGITLPVAEVNRQLGRMWQPGREGSGAPSEFRASQMNLILHFGVHTDPEEAKSCFDQAIEFSQRYPSRIIVLCPEECPEGERFLEAKLFAQCYIGHAPRTMCCCEALMLGYPPNDSGDLENQISIWLENDLPTCYWFHRVPTDRIRKHYLPFTRGMRRILYDSSVEKDAYRDISWERPDRVKDLAAARILPIRQSIGQYLSGFDPELLRSGVKGVRVSAPKSLSGEAGNLCGWMCRCLESAGAEAPLEARVEETDTDNRTLSGEWIVEGTEHQFAFDLDLLQSRGCLTSKFGSHSSENWPFETHLLGSRATLSEAVFF